MPDNDADSLPRTPMTRSMIERMLRECENPSKRLSYWEHNFLESITDQYERNGSLSPKQFEILERIYAEKTS